MEPFDDILRTVREFVRDEVVPAEDEIERTDSIPTRIREKAAAMGLFGYALPEEHGGLGLSMSQDVRLAVELGYTVPAFRSMFGTNNGIAGQVIVRYGTDAQQRRWLPRLAAGEAITSFALTEDGAGSDPSRVRTRAVRDGDAFVLSGAKRFITNAPEADLLVVFARTDENAELPHPVQVRPQHDRRGDTTERPQQGQDAQGTHERLRSTGSCEHRPRSNPAVIRP